MAISLYDVSVRSFIQQLTAVSGFMEKGRAHCQQHGISLEQLVDDRIVGDMLPFRFQIISVAHHSWGAIQGSKAGVFGPPGMSEPLDYAALEALVTDALTSLKALAPADIDALEGRDVVFKIGERQMPFRVEDFLMSFSLPNLHFHATTAYDLLRAKGVPLGKRDYLGQPRIKA